jgi:adhesin/invasin
VPFATQPVVVLEDTFGNRVATAGVVVTAAVASGTGATLANAQATTDATGTATFSGLAITGPSGAYTLAFTASGLTGVSSGSITLAAGGPARLALATAALVAATNGAAFPVAPVVRLEDAAGNAVALAGVPVTVALASGAPALSGTATVLTDANGEAAFTDLVITGATGVRTLAFSAVGLIGVTSGGIAVVAGPATEMLVVAGDGQSATAGSAVVIAPSVRVRDESQNPVAGVVVTFAVTAGGGSIVPATTVTTDANGLATLTSWTLGASVGTNTLEASVAGLTGSPVLFTATGTAGGATQLAISGGNNLTGPVGTTLGTAHEVRVTDANGNPVAGVSITWAAVGGGSVAPLASVTDADGRATAVRTLGGTAGAQTTTATTTIGGGPVSVTFTVTATVGGATQMALAGGDLQVDSVGSTLATPLAVVVRDALNNPVPGVLISWSVVDGGGSISPATSTTDAAGIATASWTLGTATSATDSTQLARASGVGSPVNFVATSRPGGVSVAQTTVAVSPASVAASRGTPATVTVTARDRFGNMVPGRTVTLSASGVGNTIAQPAAVTGANGITTGAIGATASGVRTIVASVDGLTVTQQPTLLVTAAPASAVVFTSVPATAVSGAFAHPGSRGRRRRLARQSQLHLRRRRHARPRRESGERHAERHAHAQRHRGRRHLPGPRARPRGRPATSSSRPPPASTARRAAPSTSPPAASPPRGRCSPSRPAPSSRGSTPRRSP